MSFIWLVVLAAASHFTPAFAQTSVNLRGDEPIRPLPQTIDFDRNKAMLGRHLFFDKRLSRNNSVSCASCHDFSKGGADGRKRSPGVDGHLGVNNTPSIFNVGFNFRQLWTGKAGSLEEQLDLVIRNRKVMDSSWEAILGKLSKDADMVRAFRNAYADGLTPANARDALAVFMRSLVTPSRFDAYLRGQADAITVEEKQGYAKFKSYGCIACHQGINVGGNMYQVFGVIRPYPLAERSGEAGLGRYQLTRRESDRHVYKVPSLRNIALTAPYFHDGSAATLEEAVDVMFEYQLGRTAPADDKALIIKFLRTLSGEVPQHALPGPNQ